MKRIIARSLRKWIYLILLGLVMYILGFVVAQMEIIKRDQAFLAVDDFNQFS